MKMDEYKKLAEGLMMRLTSCLNIEVEGFSNIVDANKTMQCIYDSLEARGVSKNFYAHEVREVIDLKKGGGDNYKLIIRRS